nr:hypothetical protein [uncultured bacterium]
MLDFNLKLVGGPQELIALTARLESAPALALDIETVNWWDRRVERVALIQLAFREGHRLRVAVVDALAGLDLERLRAPLESGAVTKAIHNAAYDATRLLRHFRIRASPIHDTMLAARRRETLLAPGAGADPPRSTARQGRTARRLGPASAHREATALRGAGRGLHAVAVRGPDDEGVVRRLSTAGGGPVATNVAAAK